MVARSVISTGGLLDHLAQDADRVGFDRTGKLNVLDDVEPPFAQLDLRDIGLRALEPRSDIFLSQPCALARFTSSERSLS